MCAVLEISHKTYYKYRNKEDSDYYDYLVIKKIFDDSKGTYGYSQNCGRPKEKIWNYNEWKEGFKNNEKI